MFDFIEGKLVRKENEFCVLNVGGIGFRVFTSIRNAESAGDIGSNVLFYTYLQVKEDDMKLYGFTTKEEMILFTMLITVSGVGPKGALAILNFMTPEAFGVAVATDNFKAISGCKGVGTKTAQRIVLELKDKIKTDETDAKLDADEFNSLVSNDNESDAVSALMVLGINKIKATEAVKKIYTDNMPLDEIVKLALKYLGR